MKYAQLQVLAIQQDAALQCNIMKRRDAEEPRDDVLRRQVNEIIRLGVKGRHIAEVVGVNEGTISRWREAKARGRKRLV